MREDGGENLVTLSRGLKALSFINIYGDSSATAIGRELNVSRTAAFRILETFLSEGYLTKDPRTKKYSLTSKVQHLSAGYDEERWISDIAGPHISELSREIGWPCMLSTPIGCNMTLRYITDHESPLALIRYAPGFLHPIIHCDGGLVYLAHCPSNVREFIIAEAEKSDDPHLSLAKDRKSLSCWLQRISEEGYCLREYPEYIEGGFAVPLFDGKSIRATLGMRYMKNAMHSDEIIERYVPKLSEISQKIQAEIEESLGQASFIQVPQN